MHYLRGLQLIKGRKVIIYSGFCWLERALSQMEQIVTEAGGTVVARYSCKLRADLEEFDEAIRDVL
ncbi:MAG: hypothetical protein EOM58_13735 [Clostridia bacterium]|nr:hypothetical protein [Clostridia bacterium]